MSCLIIELRLIVCLPEETSLERKAWHGWLGTMDSVHASLWVFFFKQPAINASRRTRQNPDPCGYNGLGICNDDWHWSESLWCSQKATPCKLSCILCLVVCVVRSSLEVYLHLFHWLNSCPLFIPVNHRPPAVLDGWESAARYGCYVIQVLPLLFFVYINN